MHGDQCQTARSSQFAYHLTVPLDWNFCLYHALIICPSKIIYFVYQCAEQEGVVESDDNDWRVRIRVADRTYRCTPGFCTPVEQPTEEPRAGRGSDNADESDGDGDSESQSDNESDNESTSTSSDIHHSSSDSDENDSHIRHMLRLGRYQL